MKRLIATCILCAISMVVVNGNALAETMGEPPITSSKYCVDASKVEPALQEEFVEAVAKLFEATPCKLGEPRIVVTIVRETDLCQQAKARLTTDTKTAVQVLLNNCPKEEADRAAILAMRQLENEGRMEDAILLAERFGLTDEAFRLRTANIGYLRVVTKPDARFSIDGVGKIESPTLRRGVEVQAGHHALEFANKDNACQPLTLHVLVERGKTASVKAVLDCPETRD